MSSFFFIFRKTIVWVIAGAVISAIVSSATRKNVDWVYAVALIFVPGYMAVCALSHVRRVRLLSDRVDSTILANRHRRQIEMPFPADAAFSIVDAAIRELPHVEHVESTRDSLQIHADVLRVDPYSRKKLTMDPHTGLKAKRNRVRAIVLPGEDTSTLKLVCEPQGGAWTDLFTVDDGTNFENMEAISRAITRRVAEARRGEQAQVRDTATDKELAIAKLSLLHAQVEPHFLYNTLASAQLLTRSDAARADQLLGHLIAYLRNSVPSAENSMSTLSVELERARAYLEILKVRMGDRLSLQILVPEALRSTPMPPMMLQTLVENAIKHGLEPVTGGGTIWIIAREQESKVSVTVADDGRGFSEQGGGTGIGLKNIRERLRLAYGEAASFAVVANFPRGVAATITVPISPSPLGEGLGRG
jgi:signal transduction histidine kinase